MKNVDIVVPCYNEEESLKDFYIETQKIFKTLPDYKFTYIFVNDGSKDQTLPMLEQMASFDKNIKYVSFSRNFGKEAAIYAGLQASTSELVCLIDADLQHPPALIPEMLAGIEEGYDCCAGRRVSRDGEPKIRSFFSRQFYKLINKMSDIDLVDGAVDFRVMNRAYVDAVLQLSERQRFSKGLFTWIGFDTKWIEFKNIERANGESKWSFFSLFKYAIDGVTSFSTVPLRFATVIGAIVSAVSFIYLIYVLVRAIFVGIDTPGYTTTIFSILFIGGIIILSCGILGEYIARIYKESKNRPVYIVKKTNVDDKNKTNF
ncbi:MAG: glycosyltransferase family 2 protein [Clostridia bacterium]|nr:glycosyltransferase family 2 protein [Clostridia bacterium]